jgi:hypothetical protein
MPPPDPTPHDDEALADRVLGPLARLLLELAADGGRAGDETEPDKQDA